MSPSTGPDPIPQNSDPTRPAVPESTAPKSSIPAFFTAPNIAAENEHKKYKSVNVLLYCWGDLPDLVCSAEQDTRMMKALEQAQILRKAAKTLERVFRDYFHYKTELDPLSFVPKEQDAAQAQLEKQISEAAKSSDLIIVYYVGHGSPVDGNSEW